MIILLFCDSVATRVTTNDRKWKVIRYSKYRHPAKLHDVAASFLHEFLKKLTLILQLRNLEISVDINTVLTASQEFLLLSKNGEEQ